MVFIHTQNRNRVASTRSSLLLQQQSSVPHPLPLVSGPCPSAPMLHAVLQDDAATIGELLGNPQLDVNEGWPALTIACMCNSVAAVHALLTRPDIDVNASTADGTTALTTACAGGHMDVVEALLAHSAVDVNLVSGPRNNHALRAALEAGQSAVAEHLLKCDRLYLEGLQEQTGLTPYHAAALACTGDCIEVCTTVGRWDWLWTCVFAFLHAYLPEWCGIAEVVKLVKGSPRPGL